MNILYKIYQLLVCLPLLGLSTILTALLTIIGCTLGKASFWAYWPPCIWSKLMCRIPLLQVDVIGREKLQKGTSYVFVANHQGPYDIFLIYGYLGHSFRWLMKKELRRIPLIGRACEKAGHIMVDKSGPKAIARTQALARETLKGGISIVVFPEGSRTFTGCMASFRRGPFMLGHQLRLPIVPVTIDGSFDVLPRQKGFNFLTRHKLRLVIHDPIPYREDLDGIMQESYSVIESALPPHYRGMRENSDQ
jgi:1-acyl-sn-glycerol-3-phosphate acyltransferase